MTDKTETLYETQFLHLKQTKSPSGNNWFYVHRPNAKDVVVIVPTNGSIAHFPMGSEVNLTFNGNVAHVFSKETEKNLEY